MIINKKDFTSSGNRLRLTNRVMDELSDCVNNRFEAERILLDLRIQATDLLDTNDFISDISLCTELEKFVGSIKNMQMIPC